MRVETYKDNRDDAIKIVAEKLEFRLKQKGNKTFTSTHEILGVVAEEYAELIHAVQNNNPAEVIEELKDIAVACIFGIVSINKKNMDW